jgi:predicted small lipoprotein YifL
MTRALARLTTIAALLVALSACGNKGPLVLPDHDKAKPSEKAKSSEHKDEAKPAEPHR